MTPDTPRFLHRRSQYGYTDRPERAMHAEPEAVSDETQEWITYRAHRTERDAQRLEWNVRRVNIQREMDWLYSQRFERDVSKQLRQLRRLLDRVDKLIAAS